MEQLFLEELMKELTSTVLMIEAHPDNEQHSEFADRLDSLYDLKAKVRKMIEEPAPLSIFQKMHILNLQGAENKTHTCVLFNQLVAANMVKAGGHVTMGVDRETLMSVTLNPEKLSMILVAIDRKSFDELK